MTVLTQFASEYQSYHGLSVSRCHRQQKELASFAAFSGKASPELCDAQDLRKYLADLVTQGLHVNTVRKRGNYIRPFFSWCYEAGHISGETLMAVRAIRNPNGATNQSTPKPYTTAELREFWQELKDTYPDPSARFVARFRRGTSRYAKVATMYQRTQIEAVVALALDLGLRQVEIHSLSIDDMHPDNAYVIVRQRGERENGKDHHRSVPHTEASRTAVRLWFRLRSELGPDHDKPWLSLYPNQAGEGYLKPMQEKTFRLLLGKVGGEKRKPNWRLHRMRHTCATNWLRAGVNIEVVSRMLGHSSVKQTLCYAEIIASDIEKQVAKSEGRFKSMTGRE